MKFPADKVGHFQAGALTCCFSAVVGVAIGYSLTHALIAGALMSLIAGLAKEVYDWFHPKTHTVDRWDALATFAGGVSVTAFIALVRLVVLRG